MNNHLLKKILVYPYLKGQYDDLKNFKDNTCFPAGHFYSPLIKVSDVKQVEELIWPKNIVEHIEGINLFQERQAQLLSELHQYYNDLPFQDEKKEGLRYHYINGFYSYSDGIILYSMLRHYKPQRVIEIGSGFSSAVMLDTNELFFEGKMNLTFIDPYPERLKSILKEEEKEKLTILAEPIQSIDTNIFKSLEAGDILFIDSSHVVKTGSDLHHILFNIIPTLKKGVLIHFHDIFFPFEYPKKWVYEGRNWNENYFLRSFLMYNESFEIRLFTNFMHRFHSKSFEKMPLCYKNKGANIWIEKVR